jgi:hypothetical protein
MDLEIRKKTINPFYLISIIYALMAGMWASLTTLSVVNEDVVWLTLAKVVTFYFLISAIWNFIIADSYLSDLKKNTKAS